MAGCLEGSRPESVVSVVECPKSAATWQPRLVHEGEWKRALERLLDTNNFPEFTGVQGEDVQRRGGIYEKVMAGSVVLALSQSF